MIQLSSIEKFIAAYPLTVFHAELKEQTFVVTGKHESRYVHWQTRRQFPRAILTAVPDEYDFEIIDC
jgi:hypothetical protein